MASLQQLHEIVFYLMGRIPLLTREQEIAAAVAIEESRFVFRNTMLATDFMLRGAVDAALSHYREADRLDPDEPKARDALRRLDAAGRS